MTRAEFHDIERERLGAKYDQASVNKTFWEAVVSAIRRGLEAEIPLQVMQEYAILRAAGLT